MSIEWAGARDIPQLPFRRLFAPLNRPVPADASIVTAYTDGQVTLRSNRSKVGYHEAADLSGFQGVQPGDFVVHGLDIMRGSIGVADSAGAISAVCTVCRPLLDISLKYVAYVMRIQASSGYPKALARGVREGGADFRRWDTLAELPIPVLPVADQNAIVEFLDRETAEIDAFIADQEDLIALLTERRSATISHAVTKGLDPSVPMKDSGIEWLGEIPSSWTTPKVKWHASIRNGATPSREESAYWSGGSVPWLSSTVVNLPEVVEPTELVTELAVASCHLPMIPQGSVLVGLTGQGKTRGMATRLAFESTINQHIAALTPRAALSTGFLHWVITAAYRKLRLESDGNGGTKGGLTCEQLGSLRIPMPPSGEQAEITQRLINATAEIDAAVADAREAIALSKERRAALISAAVTGKIDVRNHGGVE